MMELEKLKDMLYNAAGGPVGIQMCHEAADAIEQLQAANEKLRDELEQVREDNKKLCSAMMTIRRSENSERMCAEYRVDYCTSLSHQETADLARIVFEDLMRTDARMRGPQKENTDEH